jgi:cytochrome b
MRHVGCGEEAPLSDQVRMGLLLVSGLIMTGGLAFQLTTGMRMRRSGSASRRKTHRLVGYVLIAVVLLHLPFGVIDTLQAFTG